eukprot:TRINITY_DN3718_c0_g1_i4.p1 TRINITY_DN3718_c0_g1~~TRINITY_DN3718_c0_g1_i4.p1  ORF type:complete len:524 (+),score=89.53 TRINITY_DN3718_c0_g1_i4:118-1689(+)
MLQERMCALLKTDINRSPGFNIPRMKIGTKSEDGDITPTGTELGASRSQDILINVTSESRDIPLSSYNYNRRRKSASFDVIELKRISISTAPSSSMHHSTIDLTDDPIALATFGANKENFDPCKKSKLSVPCDIPKRRRSSQAYEWENQVFKFSVDEHSPQKGFLGAESKSSPAMNIPMLRLASDTDSVFLSPTEGPHSCLLLTPSTTYSPRPSSCTSIQLDYSPDIHLGISCNTPSRMKLEMEGLGAEKLVLGRGAYGTVVLGQWRGQKVAVKVMEKEEGPSARRRKSIESEIQALKLEHDNIVKLHGIFAAQDRYSVIIMEYVGSRNLHRLLIETPEKVIGKNWLLGAGRQISSALSHCHSKGVLHLDVKPANILVTSNGTCKLGDFGCSVAVNSGDLVLDHSLVGTPGYQAPEFLRGFPPSPACDIYSLGILYWQLDSRQVPFQGKPAHTIMFCTGNGMRPKDPLVQLIGVKEFTVLYRTCWSNDPSKRPAAPSIYRKLCQIIAAQSSNLLSTNMKHLRI